MEIKKFITIGIPTRNRSSYLRDALESAMNQTYTNIEIVVSDNASSDDTQDFLTGITDTRVKVFRQESMLEMIDNWNFCLKNSSGKYFVLLSDDDILEVNAVESIFNAFHNTNFMGEVAAFSCVIINEQGSPINHVKYSHRILSKSFILSKYLFGFFTVPMCSTIHDTNSLRQLGSYSSKHVRSADGLAWLLSVFKSGNLYFFSENIAKYRVHSQMTTKKSLTSLWIKEYINLFVTAQKEVPLLEKPLALCGLMFVVFKQILKGILSFIKVR